MDHELLRIERDGAVATVVFDRPAKGNALSHQLLLEIEAASLAFRGDVEIRVVVFTGEGRHFSTGHDLRDTNAPRPETFHARMRAAQAGPRVIRAIGEIDQITIAAVNGVAAGGGACIATACDFRVGAANATVCYPEVPLGMNLSWIALPLCVHLVGPARAKRLVILGEKLKAETLEAWGLFDEVVPEAELRACARALADRYAAMPPIPTQMVKKSVDALVRALDRSTMHMDMDQLLLTHQTEDFREGIRAWAEKRPAVFKGD